MYLLQVYQLHQTLGTPMQLMLLKFFTNGFTLHQQQGSVVVPNDAVAPTGLSITSAVGFVEGTGSVVVPTLVYLYF